MPVRRLVIDVLMPLEPSIVSCAEKISSLEHTDGVNIHVLEIDEKTRSVEMTIEGEDLSFDTIKEVIEDMGGSVHSIDRVSAGSRIVESKWTDTTPR
jgi:hypothetical protein